MNKNEFERYQKLFLKAYPGGFQHESMLVQVKKHAVPKWVQFVQAFLSASALQNHENGIKAITKLVTGSSLISVFEKTAFKNMIQSMSQSEKTELVESVSELLHKDQETGFVQFNAILSRYQNAKWPIITTLMYYSNPEFEVLIKPSTVKKVISALELEPIKYLSKPDYSFYCAYRDAILEMKTLARPELQVENGAFCGFLMYAVEMASNPESEPFDE